MHQHPTESSQSISLKRCQSLSQSLNQSYGWRGSFGVCITDNASPAAQIGDQCGMWLVPFSLFELESESESFAFEKLNGIDGVGGKQAGVISDKNTGLASIRLTAAEIRTSCEPCECCRVLQQHCICLLCMQQLSDFVVFEFDICQSVLVLQQSSARCTFNRIDRRGRHIRAFPAVITDTTCTVTGALCDE
jgi:hypothetical protein